MVNASLKSYVVHHNQSGLSCPFLRGTGIGTTQYIYKYIINANKAINELKTKIFQRVQCLWDYMVVKASLRSYIVHHDQSGLSCPNHTGKNGGYSQYDMHNVVNVNKVINDIIYTWGCIFRVKYLVD
jgi:hypothetical protein